MKRILLTNKETKLNNLFDDLDIFTIVWENLQYDNLDDNYTIKIINDDDLVAMIDDYKTTK
jgi:hypothetical protein